MIYFQVIGCGIFVMSTIVSGLLLRRHPSKKMAETTSRVMHFLLLFSLMAPNVAGFSDQALWRYDEFLGIPSLPFRIVPAVAGAVMMLIGLCFICVSLVVLLDCGGGLPAFDLTKRLAAGYIYARTRNPMALGFSLIFAAIGVLAGSTSFILWSLSVIIPALIFYLKYFEECELEIRFGQSYLEYKQRVPFMIPRFRNVSGAKPTNDSN